MWWVFEEIKYRLNPANRYDVKLEKELYKKLRKLGYKFFRSEQFNSKTFSEKDKVVVPLIIEYIEKFEHQGIKGQFISSLGVKGFCDATEYLIEKYKKNCYPNYNQMTLNIVSQTLARICDLRFVDTYLELLSSNVTMEAGYIVEMLGKCRVEKAIPTLIKLVDCKVILAENWIGNPLEEHRYYVSQMAIKVLGQFANPEYIQFIEKFLEPEKLEFITFSDCADKKWLFDTTYRRYKKITQTAIQQMSK